MLQPKDTDWLDGYKNKTHIYVVYKKPTSDLKTHIDWKWEISNKIDLKIKKITRDKEGHYIMIKGLIQEEDMTIVTMHPTEEHLNK